MTGPRHPSSAQVLAWMDGELPFWRRLTISRHLKGCWKCRNRSADLADTIRLAPSFLPASLPDRMVMAKAKWGFHERVRQFEAERGVSIRRNLRERWVAGIALTVALATVFAAPLVIRRATVESPARVAPRAGTVPRLQHVESRPALPAIVNSNGPGAVRLVPSPLPAPREQVADPGELDSAEVDVWSILHRSRLCLSGEVSVRRSSREIEISGVLPTEDRKTQLQALLATAHRPDLLAIALRTVSEVPAAGGGTAMQLGTTPAEAPAEKWLRERMRVGDAATQREMFDVMNALVGSAQSLLEEAWALRRLAERFPVGLERALAEPERAELRGMAEDHAIAVQTHIAAIAQVLRPLGVTLPTRDPKARSAAWQAAAGSLQQRAAEYAGKLLSLFAAGGRPDPLKPGMVEAEIAEAAAGLSEIRELAALERGDLTPALRSAISPTRPED